MRVHLSLAMGFALALAAVLAASAAPAVTVEWQNVPAPGSAYSGTL